jgi:hypothetical protein
MPMFANPYSVLMPFHLLRKHGEYMYCLSVYQTGLFFTEFVTGQNCTEKPSKGQLFSTQVQIQEKELLLQARVCWTKKGQFFLAVTYLVYVWNEFADRE